MKKMMIVISLSIFAVITVYANASCQSKSDDEAPLSSITSEERSEADQEGKSYGRIDVTGVVALEFGADSHDIRDPANSFQAGTTDNQDLTLAIIELGLDTEITKYVQTHILLIYEEDDTEEFTVDEGTIALGGAEKTHGLYLLAGKYYPRFGEFNSYFISNPLTLEVFEINETAVQAGIEHDWVSASAGVFHGNVEDQFESGSRINAFFADLNLHNPEGTCKELSLLLGASYLSNIADSDTLQGQVNDMNGDGITNDLAATVNGLAVYLIVEYGRIGFGAEYILTLDEFLAGEMTYAVDRNGLFQDSKPVVWNLELAYRLFENCLLGMKYEGSDDMFGLCPEKQYGCVFSWMPLRCTTFSAEYLHGEFEENNRNADGLTEEERDLFTLQLAVEF